MLIVNFLGAFQGEEGEESPLEVWSAADCWEDLGDPTALGSAGTEYLGDPTAPGSIARAYLWDPTVLGHIGSEYLGYPTALWLYPF